MLQQFTLSILELWSGYEIVLHTTKQGICKIANLIAGNENVVQIVVLDEKGVVVSELPE